MKDAKEYIKQISTLCKSTNQQIKLTDAQKYMLRNLQFAYQNYKDTAKLDDKVLELCDNMNGIQNNIICRKPGLIFIEQKNATNNVRNLVGKPNLPEEN